MKDKVETAELVSATKHEHLHEHTAESLLNEALARLKERGGRATASRQAVLEVLVRHSEHLSADDVAAELEGVGIHRTTVYRTLERFSSLGILAFRQLPGQAGSYHLASASHLHGHCLKCEDVVALPPKILDDLKQEVQVRSKFALDLQKITFVGVCPACAEQNESSELLGSVMEDL